jgi:hypothetical protein
MKKAKKQAQSLVPVGVLFCRSRLSGGSLFFLFRQVNGDFHQRSPWYSA